jgi:hypothetical protein
MFASIKYRPITISRLAIPESSDGCAPPSRPAQANIRFRGALPGSRVARLGRVRPKVVRPQTARLLDLCVLGGTAAKLGVKRRSPLAAIGPCLDPHPRRRFAPISKPMARPHPRSEIRRENTQLVTAPNFASVPPAGHERLLLLRGLPRRGRAGSASRGAPLSRVSRGGRHAGRTGARNLLRSRISCGSGVLGKAPIARVNNLPQPPFIGPATGRGTQCLLA